MNIVPDLPLVLAQIAPPLVLMFGLQQILLKPMLAYLAERRQVTTGVKAEAEAVTAKAEAKVQAWEAAMEKARGEVADVRAARRAAANQRYQEVVAAARREAEERIQVALTQLRKETGAARTELRPRAQAVASLMTETILGHGPRAEA